MAMVEITIDGKRILAEEGTPLLDAALDNGIYIPNLCHHPDLQPIGACKLCLVEVEGVDDVVTSCTVPVEAGMAVRTNTQRVLGLRRLSMELMLADHPADCSSCMRYGSCPMQSLIQYVGAGDRLRKFTNNTPENFSHPLFIRDMHRCIKCGRCVRVCREVRGVKAIDYYRNENQEILVGSPTDQGLLDKCRDCCACVEVCPTGALRDKPETFALKGETRAETLVPCRLACPAHTDVVRYLRFIREGRYGDAVATIREKAPFPAILGHVCTHPCEEACRRGFVNEAVSIRNLKRYAAEHDNGAWKAKSVRKPATGKRVAVVGAGPAGMTAAYYLAKQGHSVTVFEELPEAGGMTRYGIPEYRLPRDVIAGEVAVIREAGVEFVTGTRVTDARKLLADGYQAVCLAIGAHGGVKLPLEGGDLPGVLLNIEFLRAARMDKPQPVGKRVVVLGGGNVAFDCARMARRLGAEEVHVACLEARDAMTASDEEIRQGCEEGIVLHPASSFARILGDSRVEGIVLEDVESFQFDENHRAVIQIRENSAHTIPADTVIFAVGQRPVGSDGFGLALGRGGCFAVKEGGSACSEDGIFACGDCVTGTDSVIRAIAGGRTAAEEIDRYLGGSGDISERLAPEEEGNPFLGECQAFGELPRVQNEVLPAGERVRSCSMAEAAFDEGCALAESGRCLQCDLRAQLRPMRLWGEFSQSGGGDGQ